MHDPLWFKDAVIYETHVKTFYDSNGDGIGDFGGAIQKLDYLQNLGVTAIWVLPFYPSPLRDDGYDIADYYQINPQYGTMDDFRAFLEEAHRRDLRVITELVLNHTSDQHAWFQRARKAPPGSPERDFYVWNDSPQKYQDARIIFKDFEASNWTWDPVAKAYYWHRFFSHQPDLNYDNPAVEKAMFAVIDFWLETGVDGLRLDAVPYLYEREGTNCENLQETHDCLQRLRAHIDRKFQDRMLLAEANQWPEDAVPYFGDGDKCHMAFHFPVMPRMFMALQMEDRFPILDILDQTPAIPDSCQWAMFLRNHDELTLEMVTDEERDYMYRVYAKDVRARINLGIRRRLAPLLDNNRRKIELINTLLFSLPGTPILYYGDEIGMGDNFYLGDRNGVRTPMQWSSDKNAGFSRANPQQLYLPITMEPEYHYETVNVETQERNLSSLLWWTRRVIAVRKKYPAFGRGTLEFLLHDNSKVLSFLRQYEDQTILVVVNLSRFSQAIELDLSRFKGSIPIEIFGRNRFPAIKDAPYSLTLTQHGHFWLLIEPGADIPRFSDQNSTPALRNLASWSGTLDRQLREALEKSVLPQYLPRCRWFAGKARMIRETRITEQIPVPGEEEAAALLLFLRVDYIDGASETYLLPIQNALDRKAEEVLKNTPNAVIAHSRSSSGVDQVLYDASADEAFRKALLRLITTGSAWRSEAGKIIGEQGSFLSGKSAEEVAGWVSHTLSVEQSNSSITYGDQVFCKLYRKIEEGENPDLEITRFLTEKKQFPMVPAYAGSLQYIRSGHEPQVLALLQAMVPNESDAWSWTVDSLVRFYERVLGNREIVGNPPSLSASLFETSFEVAPEPVRNLIGGVYSERVILLGQRTGEMHLALVSEEDPEFSIEPFSMLYQRSIHQSMRGSTRRAFEMLRTRLDTIPAEFRDDAVALLGLEGDILFKSTQISGKKISAMKMRVHGDYHLGQVLFTGKDFVIIDFEGEPARPLSERKIKRSPLRDVAGMLRSFHYAAYAALLQRLSLRPAEAELLQPWAELWSHCMGAEFLRSYLKTISAAGLVPEDPNELKTLLHFMLLDKAMYELSYELNNRPSWVFIPMKGIRQVLDNWSQ